MNRALWLQQSATWAEDIYIYITYYVFERGAGALQGSAPALPPPPTTGGGLRSAAENIIVIM